MEKFSKAWLVTYIAINLIACGLLEAKSVKSKQQDLNLKQQVFGSLNEEFERNLPNDYIALYTEHSSESDKLETDEVAKVSKYTLKTSKIYPLTKDPIDVVFVAHAKDLRTLDLAIEGVKINVKNIRRIVVISAKKLTDKAEWFNEALFPFSINNVTSTIKNEVLHGQLKPIRSTGWIYQQLLKLYAPFVVPGLSPNMLTVDADTIFLNPVEFIDDHGNALYNVGIEYHKPYFEHAKKLISNNPIIKVFPNYSGICHHMLLQRPVIEDLFDNIKQTHHMEPWQALLKCINSQDLNNSCISEYEIYFNFVFARTDQVKLRFLIWQNLKFNIEEIKKRKLAGYHYVSCHSYLG